MCKRVLLIATVQSHIGQFHKPLMKMLKEYGWEIHVAARDNLAEKDGLKLEYPDRVFDVPFQRSPLDYENIAAYRQLKKILKNNRYDVIHCNTPIGGVLGRLAGRKYRKSGTEIYYMAHGFHFYKGAPLKNWILFYPIEKYLSRITDKLITISEQDYQFACKKFKCPVYHTHGVGVNSSKYYPISEEEQTELKKELGIKGHILLNVGELLPNKNQKTAISAMKYVVERFPDTHLLIAGNGPERTKLEQMAVKLGLESNIIFLGYTCELYKYLQICDAEIACSYREGMPLNIMEAMLCGKTVIASHNRGHDELVVDGVTGYLVEPDDVIGIYEAVIRVFNTAALPLDAKLSHVNSYTDKIVRHELKQIYGL